MQAHEHDDFAAMVVDALAYYRQNVSEFTLHVWIEGCKPYTLEQVQKAMTAHMTDAATGQFAPKVADIVRILSGTHTDRSMLAWGKAYEAMSSVGAYTDVVFDDPAVHAVIEDLGGWPKVCRSETKDLSYLQHRFCEAYKAYSGRGTFDYPRRLMGDRSADSEYTKKGLPLPRPAVVGDREKAKEVYSRGGTGGKTAISYRPLEVLQGVELLTQG